ncbi:hypothetical protein TNCV_3043831, partial [Trichonephila clavipes]
GPRRHVKASEDRKMMERQVSFRKPERLPKVEYSPIRYQMRDPPLRCYGCGKRGSDSKSRGPHLQPQRLTKEQT